MTMCEEHHHSGDAEVASVPRASSAATARKQVTDGGAGSGRSPSLPKAPSERRRRSGRRRGGKASSQRASAAPSESEDAGAATEVQARVDQVLRQAVGEQSNNMPRKGEGSRARQRREKWEWRVARELHEGLFRETPRRAEYLGKGTDRARLMGKIIEGLKQTYGGEYSKEKLPEFMKQYD